MITKLRQRFGDWYDQLTIELPIDTDPPTAAEWSLRNPESVLAEA